MEDKSNVCSSGALSFVPLRDILPKTLDELGKACESEMYLPGLSTGISAIDRKILGLEKSNLIVLASRPGMGKTSLALNMALNVAKNSTGTVAIFSLTAKKEKIAERLLSIEALVDNYRIKMGEMDELDWEKIAAGIISLSRAEILIDDNPKLTVEDMSEKCQNIDNLLFVVIDDLQFIKSADGNNYANESRYEAVSAISKRLKIMARELDVPVLCLSQINRANEKRDDKRPQLSDLRDSGAIEEYADIIIFLYRDEHYNKASEKHNIAECIVAKNRDGETGTVELRWIPQYTIFATIENREGAERWTSGDMTP